MDDKTREIVNQYKELKEGSEYQLFSIGNVAGKALLNLMKDRGFAIEAGQKFTIVDTTSNYNLDKFIRVKITVEVKLQYIPSVSVYFVRLDCGEWRVGEKFIASATAPDGTKTRLITDGESVSTSVTTPNGYITGVTTTGESITLTAGQVVTGGLTTKVSVSYKIVGGAKLVVQSIYTPTNVPVYFDAVAELEIRTKTIVIAAGTAAVLCFAPEIGTAVVPILGSLAREAIPSAAVASLAFMLNDK